MAATVVVEPTEIIARQIKRNMVSGTMMKKVTPTTRYMEPFLVIEEAGLGTGEWGEAI